jgi:hypothetical protein
LKALLLELLDGYGYFKQCILIQERLAIAIFSLLKPLAQLQKPKGILPCRDAIQNGKKPKTLIAYLNARVTSAMVAHRTLNPLVLGSSPRSPTYIQAFQSFDIECVTSYRAIAVKGQEASCQKSLSRIALRVAITWRFPRTIE